MNTSRQGLKRLSRRLHIYKGYHVDLEYAELALQNAFQEYYEVKPKANEWLEEFQQSLVDALEKEGKAGNTSWDQIIALMKREEAQKQAGQVFRAICQRNNKQSVLKATAVNSDGIEVELHSQETMVPAMAASNLLRQQECIETPSNWARWIVLSLPKKTS